MGSKSQYYFLFILFCLLTLAQPILGQEPMKVGVAGSPPFVVQKEGVMDGISVLIWESVAELEDFDYVLVPYPNVDDLLKDVKSGKVDAGVGPISITSERATNVAFTQPYFNAGLGILSHIRERSLSERVRPFFTSAFMYGVFFLLTLLAIVGALVWVAERKDNTEEFPDGPKGLANGMWFAIVTMTTVGYGDKCPRSLAGRLLTAVWMLIATISFSTLTAGIATALTLSSLNSAAITSPEDMRNERVAVVAGTTGAIAARQFGATDISCTDLPQAVKRLLDGEVEAVVFDRPALQHYVQQNPTEHLRLARSTFESQNYGFALPLDSDHLHHLNVALLKLAESGQIEEIENRWLSQPSDEG